MLNYWAKQPFEEQQKSKYPGLLIGATAAYFVSSFLRALIGVLIINTSSKNMFRKMTSAVLRSRILFFDSNPIGRIVTRFTKDISVIDMVFTYYIVMITFGILKLITTVIVVAIMSPIILIPAFVMAVIMVLLMRYAAPALVEA